MRRNEARLEKEYRKNFREVTDLWAGMRLRRRPLTLTLVFVSVVIFILGQMSRHMMFQIENTLMITAVHLDPLRGEVDDGLDRIYSGEVWRLVTPIFLHFGLLHILFNSWAITLEGTMIETARGTLRLAILVLVSAVLSNLGQYLYMDRYSVDGLAPLRWPLGSGLRTVRLSLDERAIRAGAGHDSAPQHDQHDALVVGAVHDRPAGTDCQRRPRGRTGRGNRIWRVAVLAGWGIRLLLCGAVTMKLGFVSAIVPEYTLEQVLNFAHKAGFSSVELMCWPPGKAERRYAGVTHIDVTNLSLDAIEKIQDLLAIHQVAISGLGYYPNPLSADKAEAEVAVSHLRRVIDAAAALGVGQSTRSSAAPGAFNRGQLAAIPGNLAAADCSRRKQVRPHRHRKLPHALHAGRVARGQEPGDHAGGLAAHV